MRDVVIKRRGNSLKVKLDNSYQVTDPREDDNLGHVICWHRRYSLGDSNEFYRPCDFQAFAEVNKDNMYCILNVYMYDHTGIALSTEPFNDRFDSGQVGYIYCTKQDVLNHGYSFDDYDKVEQTLKNELVDYNDYINEAHEYYAYEITDEDDNIVDNMTGFSISNNNNITMLKEMQKCADDKFHYLFNELIRIEKKRESCL